MCLFLEEKGKRKMFRDYDIWILIYMFLAGFIASAVAVHDKNAAIAHKRRVRESVLMLLAAVSGCVFMYLTLLVIRHKTRHLKFMLGIPVIFIIEAGAFFALRYFGFI